MIADLLVAVRTALLNHPAITGTPVYVVGDVPNDPAFPYITITPLPETIFRLTVANASQTRSGVSVDILAPTLMRCIELGDAAREALTGLSVPATDGGVVMEPGLHPEGPWRIPRTTQPTVSGLSYTHHTTIFVQDEIHE